MSQELELELSISIIREDRCSGISSFSISLALLGKRKYYLWNIYIYIYIPLLQSRASIYTFNIEFHLRSNRFSRFDRFTETANWNLIVLFLGSKQDFLLISLISFVSTLVSIFRRKSVSSSDKRRNDSKDPSLARSRIHEIQDLENLSPD